MWSIYFAEHGRGDVPPAWLDNWKGDGVIARIENPPIARALRKLKIPVVDVSAARLLPKLPWFETDDAAIALLAAQHLLERGFKHFAFCGDDRFNWSDWRRDHFQEAVRNAGCDCAVFEPSKPSKDDDEFAVEEIGTWVAGLPKPVGIMCCYDFRGRQVLDACRRRNLAVPESVAVIGSDNDELLCSLSTPSLSSVIPNTHRTGYEAAALLNRLMNGEKLPASAHFIEPLGVATRHSTDVLAVSDPHVAGALRFIREHACEGINVKDVLRAVPQARRALEGRFKKFLNRTPHEEIIRVQLDRARMFLAQTDLPLSVIAERSGFAHVEYLSVVFKKHVGMPPGKFRTLNQH